MSSSKSSSSPNSAGIGPVKSLPSSAKLCRLVSLPSSAGMAPCNRFRRRCSAVRRLRPPNCLGMGPVKALPLSSSSLRCASWPRVAGMGPAKALRCRRKETNRSKPASSDGIRPSIPWRDRSKAITRIGVPPRVTPCQNLMGVAGAQFSLIDPASWSRTASSKSQSACRPGLPADNSWQSIPSPASSASAVLGAAASSAVGEFSLWRRAGAEGVLRTKLLCSVSTFALRDCSSVGMAPANSLYRKSSTSSSLRLPSCAGMGPFRALRLKRSARSFANFPNSGGIRPEKPIPFKRNIHTRAGLPQVKTPCQRPRGLSLRQFSLPSPAKASLTASSRLQSAAKPELSCVDKGQNQFLWVLRSTTSLSVAGTPSANSLPCSSSLRKFGKAPSWGGGMPSNSLLAKSNDSRFSSLPSCAGTGPVNALFCRCRRASWSSRPISWGIRPLRPASGRCRRTTRAGSSPTPTPDHKPMGVDCRQFSRPLPARSLAMANRVVQSLSRPGAIRGPGAQWRSSSRSRWRFPIVRSSSGIGALNSLCARRKDPSLGNKANSTGTSPFRRLPCKFNSVRPSKMANCAGICPRKPACGRFRALTRLGQPPSSTPVH